MPRAPSSVEIRAVASSSAGSSPSTPSCDSTTFGTEIETAAATRPSGPRTGAPTQFMNVSCSSWSSAAAS